MKPNVRIIRDAIVKVTKMLASMDIEVTQRGDGAYVKYNPKTNLPERVNIPYLPDNASDELIAATQGFLDHEVAHVLFSDGKAVPEAMKQGGKKLKVMHNIVEDCFIEPNMERTFPGSVTNLGNVRKLVFDTRARPKIAALMASPLVTEVDWFKALSVTMFRALAGHEQCRDFMDEGNKWQYLPNVLNALDFFEAEIKECKTSWDCLELAKKSLKALEDIGKPPPEDDMDDDMDGGDEEGDEEGDGKSSKSHKDDSSDDGDSGDEKSPDDKKTDKDSSSDDKDDKSDGDEDDKSDGDGDGDEEGESESSDGESGDGVSDDKDDDGAGEGEDTDDSTGGDGGDDDTDDTDKPESDETGDGADASDKDVDSDADSGEDGEDSDADSKPDDSDKPDESGSTAHIVGEDLTDAVEEAEDFEQELSDEVSKMYRDGVKGTYGSWLVFTRETHDPVPLPIPPAMPSECVTTMNDKVMSMIGPMAKHLERLILSKKRHFFESGKRSGRLHTAALHRLRSGDDRVFRRKIETQLKNTAVEILVDQSGSMHGSKMETASYASYALAQMLSRVSIPVEVTSFTAIAPSREYIGEMREAERRIGRKFSQQDVCQHWMLKGFNERLGPEQTKRFASLGGSNKYGRRALHPSVMLWENCDPESVMMAAGRLYQRPEERRILMVLSDGAPMFKGDTSAGSKQLKKVVRDIEGTGMEVIGIGIEDGSVSRYYSKNVVLRNVDALPETIMGEMKRVLLS